MSYFGTASPNPWVLVLDALEKKVNRHSYETWLKPTRFSHSKGPTLFVKVPNPDFCHIGEKYGDLISEAIENLGLEYQDVEFVTDQEQRSGKNERRSGDGLSSEAAVELPASTENSGTGPARQQRFDWDGAAQLNPKYTFDGFVIGSGNQFAHAAARAVGERPSKAYNPLFLYGGVGMGKTHLMQAIGHEIKKRNPQMAICYVSSEKFTNEMINALRNNKMTSFRDKYRNMDVLLVDDIQFLVSKERTQEEFFHTFNALHESMRQIVIASDRPPKELAEIEDRLRSRFEWGLIADIQPPDLETKVAILQKKAESEHVLLPTDVALYIASNIRSNVRELEGALIRLTAYVSLTGGDLTHADRAGGPEEPHRLADAQDHHRIHPEGGVGTVRAAAGGNQGEEQLALDRVSAPDCHVPGKATDRSVAAGNRAPVWRQTPHHRAAFGGQDCRGPQVRQGFEQAAEQTHRGFGWINRAAGAVFHFWGEFSLALAVDGL